MPFTIVRQDVTKMDVDAIVNAANTELRMGGGVCGAIFNAAGAEKLRLACDRLAPIKTGEAAITPGFALPAKYVIHAAGPIYSSSYKEQCAALLRSAYTQSLKLAAEHECKSIAFPLISAGIYGYPKAEALRIATAAISDFLAEHDMDIFLAVYDKDSFEVSTSLFSDVKAYIDETMVRKESRSQLISGKIQSKQALTEAEDKELREKYNVPDGTVFDFEQGASASLLQESQSLPYPMPASPKDRTTAIEEILMDMDKSFSETLLELIDKSGMKDSQVYKKANVDRRLFSKIRSDMQYKPSKVTAVAFALALELDLYQTRDLLEKAGYSMTHSNKFDIIIEYFITRKNYNVFEINEVLFAFDQSLIGV